MQKIIHWFNDLQLRNQLLAVFIAVLKKYGDDDAGHRAALLTYYAFLSLFPLLLVLTTLTEFISASHSGLQATIIRGTTNYFPVLGTQLADHINTLQKSGFALVAGIVFTIYGARGVADVFQISVQQIWGIPKSKRAGFPHSTLNSLAIILVAGIGFVVASFSIGWAGAAGHGITFRALTIIINLIIWSILFVLLLNISLPSHVPFKETRAAAFTAAVGLVVLQIIGSYLIHRELRHLDALYSYFALALGLLFWIYLQVQVIFYALELAAVRSRNLWPRSLIGDQPTSADKRLQSHQPVSQ